MSDAIDHSEMRHILTDTSVNIRPLVRPMSSFSIAYATEENRN